MDAQVYRIGDGNVSFKLDDGEEMVMKPSWSAAQLISQRYGGISGAVEKVIRLDIDSTIQIVLLGLGYTGTRKPPSDLAERIWRSGVTDRTGAIAEACIRYLHVLANGGRPPPEDDETPPEGSETRPSTKRSSSDT